MRPLSFEQEKKEKSFLVLSALLLRAQLNVYSHINRNSAPCPAFERSEIEHDIRRAVEIKTFNTCDDEWRIFYIEAQIASLIILLCGIS